MQTLLSFGRVMWPRATTFFALTVAFFALSLSLQAQTHRTTRIDGRVVDDHTGEGLPYVNIVFEENLGAGTTTNKQGSFSLISPEGYRTLIVRYLGYATDTIRLSAGENRRNCVIRLRPESVGLADVVVRPRKRPYKRKGNPAVELILKAIAGREYNRLEAAGDYSYSIYERIVFALDPFDPRRGFLGLDSTVCRTLTDSSAFSTTSTLPLSLREKIMLRSKMGRESEQSRIVAQRLLGIDERIDEGPLTTNIEEIFRPVDIYAPDVPILLKRIPSPLHPSFATYFYKYFIQDTVMLDSVQCIELSFVPFEPHAAGFTGRIWLTMEQYAVRRVELNLPIAANVNWVQRLRIEQEFEQRPVYGTTDERGAPRLLWVPSKQDVRVQISAKDLLLPGAINAWQTRLFTDYRLGAAAQPLPPTTRDDLVGPRASRRQEMYWTMKRPAPLPAPARKVEALMDFLHKGKRYRNLALLAHTVSSGYFSLPLPTSDTVRPLFDWGPLQTFLSGNAIEKFRMRLGGMTTAHLMPHLFLDGYVAYGTGDRRWKYRLNATYTPYRKAYHAQEFPRNNLSATVQSDLYAVGQHDDPTYKDSFSSLLGTMGNEKRQYIDDYQIAYNRDWSRSFATLLEVGHHCYRPTGSLVYERYSSDGTGNIERVNRYRITDIYFRVKWEPERVAYNGRRGEGARFNLARRGPKFTFSHRMAYAGVLGSDYSLQRTDVQYDQRLWLSLFGVVDVQAFGGIVWNTAPHPILYTPLVNESYTLLENVFQLMNPAEYIADRWAGVHATYHLNGLLLDRIPLIRKLGIREIVSGHVIWGDLSRANSSEGKVGRFIFPQDVSPMSRQLYAEGSIGLENIFKVLRVQYFHRFTGRNKPDVPKWGVRIQFELRF